MLTVMDDIFFGFRKGRRERQKGAIGGIPDVLVALAIGSVGVGGVLQMGQSGFADGKTVNEVAVINQVLSKTRDAYFLSGDYGTGSLNAVLLKKSAFPQRMVQTGAALDSWGGAVTVTGVTSTFTLSWTNVPDDACIDLVTKVPTSGLTEVSVNGTAITSFPINPGTASGACVSGADTIIWSSY